MILLLFPFLSIKGALSYAGLLQGILSELVIVEMMPSGLAFFWIGINKWNKGIKVVLLPGFFHSSSVAILFSILVFIFNTVEFLLLSLSDTQLLLNITIVASIIALLHS